MDAVCFFRVYAKGFTNGSFQSSQFNSELQQEPPPSFKQSYSDLLFFATRYSGKRIKNYQNAKAHQTSRSLWDLRARGSIPHLEVTPFP